ncbi:hypothetical protein CT0861_04720 [Colletotrichum tofieldiae]|uniref:Uncharacterized protein n=1 Tax=Colletotrichum tofieldiae TaxID=708197 RepID=A0A161VF41_9PEZI|nr:hypothetical protein CT0861_04720 [Colletotrichum tofieldiae]
MLFEFPLRKCVSGLVAQENNLKGPGTCRTLCTIGMTEFIASAKTNELVGYFFVSSTKKAQELQLVHLPLIIHGFGCWKISAYQKKYEWIKLFSYGTFGF